MFNSLRVGQRLLILTVLTLLLSVIVAAFGISGMTRMAQHTEKINTSAISALGALGRANGNVGKVAADVLLSFHHAPNAPQLDAHAGHPIDAHVDSAIQWIKILEDNWGAFTAMQLNANEKKLVDRFNSHYAPFKAVVDQTLAALRANDYSDENFNRFMRAFGEHAEILEKTIGELIVEEKNVAETLYQNSHATAESARNSIIAIFAAGLVICIGLALVLINSVVKPLSLVQRTMTEIESSGDFTRRVPATRRDEVGQAAEAFNQLVATLQTAFHGILQSVDQLMTTSAELTVHAGHAAKTSEVTSESSSSMAAAVEQMSVSITHVSDNSRDTREISQRTGSLAQQGADIIQETITRMRAMAQSVKVSSETIAALGKHSEQISGIVQVIKDVADQTNLLALNAAIEAARAGEQGRGFAVVADEVRKLAERTSAATGEIVSMISAIQDSSRAAVQAMGLAAQQVTESVTLADSAGGAIAAIQQGTAEVQQHVADINSALTEQGIASQNIAQQVERVAHAAEENSAEASASAEAVNQIKAMAEYVRGEVNRFKV
jgi:methyl-accepting chemotaxis protein